MRSLNPTKTAVSTEWVVNLLPTTNSLTEIPILLNKIVSSGGFRLLKLCPLNWPLPVFVVLRKMLLYVHCTGGAFVKCVIMCRPRVVGATGYVVVAA